jgi:hypothetical protein
MGKSTISMAIFNSFLYVYQAGYILLNRIKAIPVGDEFLIHPMTHSHSSHLFLGFPTQLSSQVSWFNKVKQSH